MWAAIASIITTLLTFFLNQKKSEATVVNEALRTAAEVERKTDEVVHEKTAEVAKDTDARRSELEHAGSLSAKNRITASAVDSANDPV